MKIGIITLTGYQNIGNRLQNYAVQKILEDRGYKATTIRLPRLQANAGLSRKISDFSKNLLEKIGIYTSKFFMVKIYKNPKSYLLREFDKKHVRSTKKYFFKARRMEKYKNDFDYYCTGSDQVWTITFVQNLGLSFLQFADSEKTFSFSASMGNVKYAEKCPELYANGFNHLGYISVRESDVSELIKNMVGRESVVLLDPTLLISKEDWLAVSRKPAVEIPQKYIATYFLSEATKEQKDFIERYAKERGCGVVNMNGELYNHVGPSEFVHLISNAEFVFTDSFHGTAFSILFNKKFVAFNRNNEVDMSSRIVTILNTFKLDHFFINVKDNKIDDSIIPLVEEINNTSMSHCNDVILAEKKKADDFLNEVFAK